MTLRWHLNMSLMDHVEDIITVPFPFISILLRCCWQFTSVSRISACLTKRLHDKLALKGVKRSGTTDACLQSPQKRHILLGTGKNNIAHRNYYRQRGRGMWSRGATHHHLGYIIIVRQLLLGVRRCRPMSVIYFLLKKKFPTQKLRILFLLLSIIP